MKIYENCGSTYSDALDHYWNLNEFCTGDKENALFAGWAYMDNYSLYEEQIKKYKNPVFFNTEHCCVFQGSDPNMIALSADSNNLFNKIFTACLFTAEWLNYREGGNRFQHIHNPFNTEYIVDEKPEKEYDTLYWGGLHNIDHLDIIDVIKEHKYNFLSMGPQTWSLWHGKERWDWYAGPYPSMQQYARYITHINLKRTLMWEMIRKTRVNVMTNLLYTDDNINKNIRMHDKWEKNKAWDRLDQYIIPQIKTRPIETAVNRCLMVVKKDPWNYQEYLFEPDKEFIYYSDKKDLQYIIEDVKINWKNYEPIIENAYNKAINNWTTKHFIEKIEKESL